MPLGRFFRRHDAPAPETDVDAEVAATDEPTGVAEEAAIGDEELLPEQDLDAAGLQRSWRERARAAIPGGTSTGSKRPEALYGEGNEEGPTHYTRASGCVLITPTDDRVIDCTMALGSVAIGYADEAVTRAVMMATASGNVAGLAHASEVEIAERLADVIPCAEAVRFLKSGAEAVSAAVRIARVATSRSHVVVAGYVGWHDWANDGSGIPDAARADVTRVAFDDLAAMERACRAAGSDLAAVVLEPVVEHLPSTEWIASARALCDELGAVLVFDELKTGFRLGRGGYQEYSSVLPDLAVFGKAMANGYPVAAVAGHADIMDAATRTWISSTLAGEAVSLAAVGAVLDWYDREDVCASLSSIGARMRESVAAAVKASGVQGVELAGLDPMWLIRFDDGAKERRFLELAVREGVLLKRGAYNFASLAHGDEDVLVDIERATSSAFVALVEERGE